MCCNETCVTGTCCNASDCFDETDQEYTCCDNNCVEGNCCTDLNCQDGEVCINNICEPDSRVGCDCGCYCNRESCNFSGNRWPLGREDHLPQPADVWTSYFNLNQFHNCEVASDRTQNTIQLNYGSGIGEAQYNITERWDGEFCYKLSNDTIDVILEAGIELYTPDHLRTLMDEPSGRTGCDVIDDNYFFLSQNPTEYYACSEDHPTTCTNKNKSVE